MRRLALALALAACGDPDALAPDGAAPPLDAASGCERPALEAVRQWKFEPAVRGGEKVASKMRIPIRFALSG